MNDKIVPFNSAVEVGLRTLIVLDASYPNTSSLGRLVVFDYLLVHSDDVDGGPVRWPRFSGPAASLKFHF